MLKGGCITRTLERPWLEKSERQELESDVQELEKILSMFDMDFD